MVASLQMKYCQGDAVGDIKKVLALDIIKQIYEDHFMSVDLCENVHLHMGELRIEFSWDEWLIFCNNVAELLAESIRLKDLTKWVPKPDSLHSYIAKKKIPLEYYKERLSIEWERNGTYHIHYRNVRLHIPAEDFEIFLNNMFKAKETRDNYKDFPYTHVTEPITATIPIDFVQPYDCGHPPGEIDDYHREGIEICKELIKQGKKVRPIALRPNGIRLDGFKRYMAQKELGIKEIEVEIIPDGAYGCQNAMPLTVD